MPGIEYRRIYDRVPATDLETEDEPGDDAALDEAG